MVHWNDFSEDEKDCVSFEAYNKDVSEPIKEFFQEFYKS